MFCQHCGIEVNGIEEGTSTHDACASPRTQLEPPRFCVQCARRMVVQVTPFGWHASCSRHGVSASP
jgi:hypothetical protein